MRAQGLICKFIKVTCMHISVCLELYIIIFGYSMYYLWEGRKDGLVVKASSTCLLGFALLTYLILIYTITINIL